MPDPVEIEDVDEFTEPALAPGTGQPGNQATFLAAFQALANRTRYLLNLITSLVGGLIGITVADVDYYLDPDGDDDDDGLTPETAWQTVAHADSQIPRWVAHQVRVFHAAGTYTIGRNFAWSARVFIGGSLQRLPVNTTDCLTTIVSGAAEASTSNTDLRRAGMVAGAYHDYFLIVDSGPATGYVRSIRNNTTTSIIPVTTFTSGLASGHNYRVVQSAVIYNFPAGGAHLVKGQSAGTIFNYSSSSVSGDLFRWIRCTGATTYYADGQLELQAVSFSSILAVMRDALLQCGVPFPADIAHTGAGISVGTSAAYASASIVGINGTIIGYATTASVYPATTTLDDTGTIHGTFSRGSLLNGGRCTHLYTDNLSIHGGSASSRFMILGTATYGGINVIEAMQPNNGASRLVLAEWDTGYEAATRLFVQQRASLLVDGCSGESASPHTIPTVKVRWGGHIFVQNTMTPGHATANDIDLGDGMPFNRNDVEAGFTRFHDGALLQRVA